MHRTHYDVTAMDWLAVVVLTTLVISYDFFYSGVFQKHMENPITVIYDPSTEEITLCYMGKIDWNEIDRKLICSKMTHFLRNILLASLNTLGHETMVCAVFVRHLYHGFVDILTTTKRVHMLVMHRVCLFTRHTKAEICYTTFQMHFIH